MFSKWVEPASGRKVSCDGERYKLVCAWESRATGTFRWNEHVYVAGENPVRKRCIHKWVCAVYVAGESPVRKRCIHKWVCAVYVAGESPVRKSGMCCLRKRGPPKEEFCQEEGWVWKSKWSWLTGRDQSSFPWPQKWGEVQLLPFPSEITHYQTVSAEVVAAERGSIN